MTTKLTVSKCPAAPLLDCDPGIGKTAIDGPRCCMFRALPSRRSASESADSLVGPADLRDRIPNDTR